VKIYIAGKITGLDADIAAALFERAEEQLRLIGHEPFNPMRLVDQDPDRTYEEQLLDALQIMLCETEAVYMLNNWLDSKGAHIERFIASTLGRPIYEQPFDGNKTAPLLPNGPAA